jgi:hypothetical protein
MSARALCKPRVGQVEGERQCRNFLEWIVRTSFACRGAGCRLAGRGNATVGSWMTPMAGFGGCEPGPGRTCCERYETIGGWAGSPMGSTWAGRPA